MTEAPSGAHGERRWVPVAIGLVAGIPAWVALARVLAAGWLPFTDDALIGVRAIDVLSTHPPLVGAHTQGTLAGGPQAFHPGPMLYWLLAVPARTGWLWTLPATIAALNAAVMVAIAVVADRIGGRALSLVVAVVSVLAARGIGGDALARIWNPAPPVLPFVLAVLLCWGVVLGRSRWLPWLVGVASFCVQSHLTFALPVAALVVVAFGADLVGWRSDRRRDEPTRHLRAWLASGAVALVVWAAPLVQQIVSSPGNLSLLLDEAGGGYARRGLDDAWFPLARAAGWVPVFLRERTSLFAVAESISAPPLLTTVTAVLVLVGLVAVVVDGIRRRDRLVAGGAGLMLVLTACAGWITAATPDDESLITLSYTLWWVTFAGGLAWVALGTGVARWVMSRPIAQGTAQRARWSRLSARLAPVGGTRGLAHGAGALALVVAVVVTSVSIGTPVDSPFYASASAITEAARDLPDGRRYRVDLSGDVNPGEAAALAYGLRRGGSRPVLAGPIGGQMGDRYQPMGRRCAAIAVIHTGPQPTGFLATPAEDRRRLVTTEPVPGVSDGEPLSLTLIPDDGAPSC